MAERPADPPPAGATGPLKRLASTDWKARARRVASSLKAEYEAGKQGDDAPAEPIWATPQQRLNGLLAVIRQTTAGRSGSAGSADSTDSTDSGADGIDDAEVAEVAAAIRGVDWAGVRAAAAGRTTEASKAMKSMAEQVDWAKVQPVAAKVSSALIAAIATGQLGVGGRLASTVARTITDQNGLGQRVADHLRQAPSDDSIDFRNTIAAVSRES